MFIDISEKTEDELKKIKKENESLSEMVDLELDDRKKASKKDGSDG